jgi:hypothetical protein
MAADCVLRDVSREFPELPVADITPVHDRVRELLA